VDGQGKEGWEIGSEGEEEGRVKDDPFLSDFLATPITAR